MIAAFVAAAGQCSRSRLGEIRRNRQEATTAQDNLHGRNDTTVASYYGAGRAALTVISAISRPWSLTPRFMYCIQGTVSPIQEWNTVLVQ